MRISDWSSDVCSSDLTSRRQLLARIGAALVMGFAVVGMHYTGMAAASFPLGAICGAADGLTGAWTAGPIATFALQHSLLIMALAASYANQPAHPQEGRIPPAQAQRVRTLERHEIGRAARRKAGG